MAEFFNSLLARPRRTWPGHDRFAVSAFTAGSRPDHHAEGDSLGAGRADSGGRGRASGGAVADSSNDSSRAGAKRPYWW